MRFKDASAIVIVLILLFGGLFIGISHESFFSANLTFERRSMCNLMQKCFYTD